MTRRPSRPGPRKTHTSHCCPAQAPPGHRGRGRTFPPTFQQVLHAHPHSTGSFYSVPKLARAATNHGHRHLRPALSPTHAHSQRTGEGLEVTSCGDGKHPSAHRGSFPWGVPLCQNPSRVPPPPCHLCRHRAISAAAAAAATAASGWCHSRAVHFAS